GVHHPVQHRVAHRTSGASHTGSSARRRPAEGRMSPAGDLPLRNEGRRGSRIDFDEGGGYHGIPPQSSIERSRGSRESGAAHLGGGYLLAGGIGGALEAAGRGLTVGRGQGQRG